MYEYLDRRYALALYKVAEEKNKVDEYLQDLRDICDIIDNNKEVKSVIEMTDEQTSTLKSKLEKMYNKTVIIKHEIDKSIIGGLYVRVGNDVIDGSIKSKLDDMRALMLKRE